MQSLYKIRLKKGDLVMVRVGKYKGKTGKILKTHPKTNQVTIENINVVKKHLKPNNTYPQGTILEITKPIDVSKVGIFDADTKKVSRIGYRLEGGKKIRYYKTSNKEIK